MTLMTAWDMSFGMEKEEEEEEVTEELEEEEECCLNLKDTIVVEETVYEDSLYYFPYTFGVGNDYVNLADLYLSTSSIHSPSSLTTPPSDPSPSASCSSSSSTSSLPPPDTCWDAVLARDKNYDTTFVYTVRSTSIFCRPTCPARRPLRAGVAFFASDDLAAAAGFRPCKRCKPEESSDPTPRRQHAAVEKAKKVIRDRVGKGLKCNLDEVANETGFSAFHLHRTFKKLTGITPDGFARQIKLDMGQKSGKKVGAGRKATGAAKKESSGSVNEEVTLPETVESTFMATRMVEAALDELEELVDEDAYQSGVGIIF